MRPEILKCFNYILLRVLAANIVQTIMNIFQLNIDHQRLETANTKRTDDDDNNDVIMTSSSSS